MDELDLLMWVVATLVWSAVGGYERIVGPLSDDEKESFYRDMRACSGRFSRCLARVRPQTYAEHLEYFEGVIADSLIGSPEVSRRVAWAVARPRTPWWLRVVGVPITFIFSEIIPPPVRDRLGFRSTRSSRFAYRAATLSLRLFARVARTFSASIPTIDVRENDVISPCFPRLLRDIARGRHSPKDYGHSHGGGRTCESSR